MPILKIRIWRLREVKEPVQDHTANKWQSQSLALNLSNHPVCPSSTPYPACIFFTAPVPSHYISHVCVFMICLSL